MSEPTPTQSMLVRALDPAVQIERLEAWARAKGQRFFDIDYGVGQEAEWRVVLFLADDDRTDLDFRYPRTLEGQGKEFSGAVKAALSYFEEESDV